LCIEVCDITGYVTPTMSSLRRSTNNKDNLFIVDFEVSRSMRKYTYIQVIANQENAHVVLHVTGDGNTAQLGHILRYVLIQ
jgi:hypothetical protein